MGFLRTALVAQLLLVGALCAEDVFVPTNRARRRQHRLPGASLRATAASEDTSSSSSSSASTSASSVADPVHTESLRRTTHARFARRNLGAADGEGCAHSVALNVSSDPAALTTATFALSNNVSAAATAVSFDFAVAEDPARGNSTCVDLVARFSKGTPLAANATVAVNVANAPGCPAGETGDRTLFLDLSGDNVATVRMTPRGSGTGAEAGAAVDHGRVPVLPAGAPPTEGLRSGAATLTFTTLSGSAAAQGAEVTVRMEQLACSSDNSATCPAEDIVIQANPQPGEVTELEVPLSHERRWAQFAFYSAAEDTCLDFLAEPVKGKGPGPTPTFSVDICAVDGCPSKACNGSSSVAVSFGNDHAKVFHGRTRVPLPRGGAYLGVAATDLPQGHEKVKLYVEQLPCSSSNNVTCPSENVAIPQKSTDFPAVILLSNLTTENWRSFSFKPLYEDTCLSLQVYSTDAIAEEASVSVCTSDDCPLTGGCGKDSDFASVTLPANFTGETRAFATPESHPAHRNAKNLAHFAVKTTGGAGGNALLLTSQFPCGEAPSPSPSPAASPSPSPSPSPVVPPPKCKDARAVDLPAEGAAGFKHGLPIANATVNATAGARTEGAIDVVVESRILAEDTCGVSFVHLEPAKPRTGKPSLKASVTTCWTNTCPTAKDSTACDGLSETIIVSTGSLDGQWFSIASDSVPPPVGEYAFLSIRTSKEEGLGRISVGAAQKRCVPKCPGSKKLDIPTRKDGGSAHIVVSADGAKDWDSFEFNAQSPDTCVAITATVGGATPGSGSGSSSESGSSESGSSSSESGSSSSESGSSSSESGSSSSESGSSESGSSSSESGSSESGSSSSESGSSSSESGSSSSESGSSSSESGSSSSSTESASSSSSRDTADARSSSTSSSASASSPEFLSDGTVVRGAETVALTCHAVGLTETSSYCAGYTPSALCAPYDPVGELSALTERAHREVESLIAGGACESGEYAAAMCPNDPSRAPPCRVSASRKAFCAAGFQACSNPGSACTLRPYSDCYPCHSRETCDSLVGKVYNAPN